MLQAVLTLLECRGKLQGLVTLASTWGNPQYENLTTTVEVPSQRHSAVPEVFSAALCSLPKDWTFLCFHLNENFWS